MMFVSDRRHQLRAAERDVTDVPPCLTPLCPLPTEVEIAVMASRNLDDRCCSDTDTVSVGFYRGKVRLL